jgi:FKBP-type peptidyl-prolyl cis-trans isomerase FkpA
MSPTRSRATALVALAFVTGCRHAAPPPAQHATAPAPSSTPAAAADAAPASEEDKTLYTLGVVLGRNLQPFSLAPRELALVERGVRDAVAKREPLVDLHEYGPKVNQLGRKRAAESAEREKQRGKEYVERALKQVGAVQLSSGVVLRTLIEGTGDSPTDTDRVKVSYIGTLVDGKEFDSSFKRAEPSSFPLRGVIPCWTEGLQKMRVGGRAQLVCPSDTAYGDSGRPPTIPGGATLTFEIDLIEIVKDPPKKP